MPRWTFTARGAALGASFVPFAGPLYRDTAPPSPVKETGAVGRARAGLGAESLTHGHDRRGERRERKDQCRQRQPKA